jgi:PAS domain S-box-containing protein
VEMDEEPKNAPTPERRHTAPRRRTEMDALHRIARAVSDVVDPFAALVTAVEETAGLFEARLAAVIILGEGVTGRHLAVSDPDLRLDAERLYYDQMRGPQDWLESLRRHGFNLATEAGGADALPKEWVDSLGADECARLLAVPLVERGTLLGGLMIARSRDSRPLDQADTWLAENIATTLALSVGVSLHAHELDNFFAASLELLCMVDYAGHLHRLNPHWDQVLGYDPQDLEGAMFLDLVHPDDRASVSTAFADLRDPEVSVQFVGRFQARDGSYRSLEWFARPGADLICASARDITVRLAQEQALRESETRFQDLVLTTGDWIWEVDAQLRYTAATGKVEDVIGYSPEEVIGHTPLEFMAPEEARRITPIFARMIESRQGCAGVVKRNLHKDGREVVLHTACVPIYDSLGEFAGFRGVDKDVTLREKLGRALQESEDRYRLIAENTNDVIAVVDLDEMSLEYVSPSIERLTGSTPEELVGQDLAVMLSPKGRDRAQRSIECHRAASEGGDAEAHHYMIETEFVRKQGGTVPVELSVRVITDENGKARKHVALCRDITVRKAAEEALRESRKRLEDLMFVVGDWIWEADADYRYIECSEGVRSVLGYEPAEVIGKSPWDFVPPHEAGQVRDVSCQRVAAREGCSEVVNRNLHKDGREVILLTSSVPILDDTGELLGFRGIDKDITTATQTQESLRRSVVELNALWQIAETVAGPGDLAGALNTVARQICDALEAQFALVVTFGEGGEGRNIVASNSADTAWYSALFLQGEQESIEGLVRVAASGEPILVNDVPVEGLPWPMPERSGTYGFSRMLMIPLILQTQTIGALVVTRGDEGAPFRERDIEFAQAAAGSLAAAVVHTRLRVEENLRTANQVRDHLARELHDAVTQSVYSASLIAQALPTIWDRSHEDAIHGLSQLQRLVRSALAELRILLYELRPGTLAGVGLDQLLDRLGDSLAGQADVIVKIDARIEEPPPLEVKEALYRIAQEAFNNIAKHARASTVRATAVCDRSGAFLEVEDDGIGGVDIEAVAGDHMGLAIMRERAEEIGAQFMISSATSTAGTRLSVHWAAPDGILAG